MTFPVVLGIDIGSTNTKVAELRLGAGEARTVSVPTPADADGLVVAVERLVAAAVRRSGAPAAVGIASMAETGVPLDAALRPLRPLVRWDGRRGGAEELLAGIDTARVFAVTGVRPSAKATIVALALLLRSDAALRHDLSRWSGTGDLVALRLTGRLVTDHTLAARTMGYRSPTTGAFSSAFDPELTGCAGVGPEVFPEVLPPGEAAGAVSAAAADATGLAAGTPVYVAGHDHLVGAWGAGVRAVGALADSIGTTEALVRVARRVPREPALLSGSGITRTVDGDSEVLLTASTGAGAVVAEWRAVDPEAADDALALVDGGPIRAGEPMVLPYPAGRQAPEPDPAAILRVIGGPEPASARALLLGLALQLAWMHEAQCAVLEAPVDALVALGGAGARSRVLLALKADALGLPISVVPEAEPVAASAALLAAVRAGLAPPEARLPTRAAAHPRPGARDDRFAAFLAAAREKRRSA